MLTCDRCGTSLQERRAGIAAHTGQCPRCGGALTRASAEDRHHAAVHRTLGWAEDAARAGDFDAALEWLETIVVIDRQLPQGWELKRRQWLAARGAAR